MDEFIIEIKINNTLNIYNQATKQDTHTHYIYIKKNLTIFLQAGSNVRPLSTELNNSLNNTWKTELKD